ncbi:MAG TPA: Uma2 family endonuclease [Symbiobacteriaceae bacterium]|nr:Uma2 family endonuclease [Symbiobacteriaceae bacterium]
MTLPGPRLTYAEYRRLPDDKRHELVEGELLVTPAPSSRHQRISMSLSIRLGSFVLEHGLGTLLAAPTDVILSMETVLQPDLLFVARNREAIIDPHGGVQGAPDLVIEILSPSNATHDQVTKRQLYSQFGVREYWLVDPEAQSVEVLTDQGTGLETWQRMVADGILTSPTLPGLHLPVANIFG